MISCNEIAYGILQPGVGLSLVEIDDSPFNRLHLSDGVYRASSLHYAETAYLPKESWRSLTAFEMSLLIKNTGKYSSSTILIRVPERVIEPFIKLGIPQMNQRESYYSAINSKEGQAAILNAEEYVYSYLVKGDDYKIIPVFNPPGLNTTAFVPERNHFIGLHVDYLFQQTIFQRENSSNRISINLSNEDRYLIYVNFTVKDLIEIMKPTPNCSTDELVFNFFQRFPKYPVVRVTIKPGEAYIAPTQNLIHDGIGSQHSADMHLTICGHIDYLNA